MGRTLLCLRVGGRSHLSQPWVAKLIGLLRLVRLSNSLPAALLVFLGARLVHAVPYPPAVGQAAAAMWCITAFGYLSNDLSDRREDRINKPHRPLAMGVVTALEAIGLGLLLLWGAFWLSSRLGRLELGVACIVLKLVNAIQSTAESDARWR